MSETPTPPSPDRPDAELTTKAHIVVRPADMVSLLGSDDEILKVVEDAVASDVLVRGNEITLTG
ncbi:MAG TPA: phosphate starvation-inducible protein PhoH, partial [Mycobacteriales bacterium]|nr:phosphate starvation-inducible protein PhoH [Mycobacteriales bacterium]